MTSVIRIKDEKGRNVEIHLWRTHSPTPEVFCTVYGQSDRQLLNARIPASQLFKAIEAHAPEVIKAAGWIHATKEKK